jgi:hypothetical protein
VCATRNECHIVSSRGHPPAEIASDGTRCHDRDSNVALLRKATSKTSTVAKAWCEVLVVDGVVVTTGFVAENPIRREQSIGVDHQPASPQSDQGSEERVEVSRDTGRRSGSSSST